MLGGKSYFTPDVQPATAGLHSVRPILQGVSPFAGRFHDKTDYNCRRPTAKHAGDKARYIALGTAITIDGQSVRRYYERSSVHTH